MSDTLHCRLQHEIPQMFNSPKERHEYGNLIAKNLEMQLKIMGIKTHVFFEIVDDAGKPEGPDDYES